MQEKISPEQVALAVTDELVLAARTPSAQLAAPLTAAGAILLAQELVRVAFKQQPAAGTPSSAEVQAALSQAWGFLRIAERALAESHQAPSLERLN